MIRTRIAPSPTGEDIHIGNLYTAYLNWVFAQKNHGNFIIRIEDTDRERYVAGAEQKILQTLKNFGITYDEGPDKDGEYAPYRQSERLEIYKKFATQLLDAHHAYYCTCTKERLDGVRKQMIAAKQIPKYDKHCLANQAQVKLEIEQGKPFVIRLNVPKDQEVTFTDLIRGEITIHTANLDDQVLIKSDGFPTYHMAVVVDDTLMKITHVIRAEEWITSTPKHILLYEALGWEKPVFAHLPVLRNPDKSKLSKRKNPVWASWYLEQGFLPEAILNYLSLMGWAHPDQKEIFSTDEFIHVFELEKISPVGPAFDPVKLEWMNGEYIRNLTDQELANKINIFYQNQYPADLVKQTVPLIKERIKKLSDYATICRLFYQQPDRYEINLTGKKPLLEAMITVLANLQNWQAQILGQILQKLAIDQNVKNSEFFMLLRVAISGQKITPPLNESMEILGKDECILRLKKAVNSI